MKKFNWLALAFLSLLLAFKLILAQQMKDNEAATCDGCLTILIILGLVIIIINIVILVWVARDSKARGMGTPIAWMILVLFTGLIGLIIYIFSRPKGELEVCPHCTNKRLKAMLKCPHCGN